jgi:UDP-N-acetylmuramoylalanine--D-glutamate ligase
VWVIELSSFQLETAGDFEPTAAAVLNVTQDHLDWHGGMASYADDKARIFGAGTIRVLNRDDAHVMRMAEPTSAMVTFGTGEPERPECFGLVSENGMQWLAMAVPADDGEAPKRRRRKDAPAEEVALTVNRLMPADALQIRGQHNAANALAALALCRAIGLPLAPLLHGLREYRGEPHRVELVTTIGGVAYYDDSKGTNVGATVAALNGLGAQMGGASRLLLIAGGDGKGQDFQPLAEPVAQYVRAVMLIGRDAAAIRAAIEPAGVDAVDCATLEQAVERAAAAAQEGDAVLLSPACASLDMFRNYAHRAQVFVDAVREIALSRGELLA